MKLVVHPPRFRDLDGWKLVIKTVNTYLSSLDAQWTRLHKSNTKAQLT
jgi:hypothetical protein